MVKGVEIVKSTGERQLFSWRKVYRSAKRVGAPSDFARYIADELQKEVRSGWTTLQISQRVRELLREKRPAAAIKFNLFWAMTQLGPTGYPFEQYMKRIFEAQGYKAVTDKWVWGKCIRHNVDFIAENDKTVYIGECKYHNTRGIKTNVDVVLHYRARFQDIENGPSFAKVRKEKKTIKTVLVTNTQFTTQAIKYARCAGQGLLGWRYPEKNGLETIIDRNKIYPITILPSFRGKKLMALLSSKGLVLAQDVLTKESSLRRMDLPSKFLAVLKREATELFEGEIKVNQ